MSLYRIHVQHGVEPQITIDLSERGLNVNVAANEAREIVSGALRSLPRRDLTIQASRKAIANG